MNPDGRRTTRWLFAGVVALAAVVVAPVPSAAQPKPAASAPAAPVAGPSRVAEDIESKPLRRNSATVGNPTSRPTTQRSGVAAAKSGTGVFDVQRVVTALAIVLVLILLFRWFVKRFFGVAGAGRSSRAVQVLTRSPLSPKQQLVILRVGRRLLVVADAGGQMNTLSEITDPDEVAALLGQVQEDHSSRAAKSFGSVFGKHRGQYEGANDEESATTRDSSTDDELDRKEPDDPAVTSTRQELSGLMDKVRLLSKQFKSP